MSDSNRNLLVPVLAALVAAAVAWLVSTALSSEPHRETEVAAPPARTDGPALERIAALEEELARLRAAEGMAPPETPPVQRVPAEPAVTRAELEALRAEVEALRAELSPEEDVVTVAETPEFEQKVAEALKTVRKQEAVTKYQREADWKQEEFETRIAGLVEWLSLDPYQTEEMRTAIAQLDERERDLLRRWEAGEDDRVLGRAKREMHAEFDEALVRTLNTEQLSAWRERFSGGK